MFKRWRAFLAKHQAEPEESIAYRVADGFANSVAHRDSNEIAHD